MRRSRRDEMHSLPHVLWRLAEKVAPAGAGSSIISPANRRKRRASFPCRIRHRKLSRPLLIGGSRPFVPQASLRHIVPLALVPHTRHERHRLACPRLTRRCRANLRGLRLSRPLLSPPEEDAVAIRFPSPEGSGGLENELLCLFAVDSCDENRHPATVRASYSQRRGKS